jgi:hypothetical protein
MKEIKTISDEIGQRGEALFFSLITHPFGDAPLFRPKFLGDKWPTVDFLVELIGADLTTPYFFAQIKTTRSGYTKNKRLKISVSQIEMTKLALYPTPTYIIGIDDAPNYVGLPRGFIVSANGEWTESISSLTTDYPLNRDNQIALWNEVKVYWEGIGIKQKVSNFTDRRWRKK